MMLFMFIIEVTVGSVGVWLLSPVWYQTRTSARQKLQLGLWIIRGRG